MMTVIASQWIIKTDQGSRTSITPLARREQEAGCAAHLYIPDLVPGEQVDAGEDWVSYRLPDGSAWRDGVAA